jgi:hypothetical protein
MIEILATQLLLSCFGRLLVVGWFSLNFGHHVWLHNAGIKWVGWFRFFDLIEDFATVLSEICWFACLGESEHLAELRSDLDVVHFQLVSELDCALGADSEFPDGVTDHLFLLRLERDVLWSVKHSLSAHLGVVECLSFLWLWAEQSLWVFVMDG